MLKASRKRKDPAPLKYLRGAAGLGRRAKAGFSLVEVVLAIGVVAFALMALVGTLPMGLQTLQDSRLQSARANISQQIRGMLQQISYEQGGSGSGGFGIGELEQKTFYYTEDGMEAAEGDAYFAARFELEQAGVQGAEADQEVTFETSSARRVIVTLSYPLAAPSSSRKETVFTLFSARQGAAPLAQGSALASENTP
jgi:uncharacterized protein (TIGR02598 family)